jgi:3-hydroxyacyl-CoA dehydrogenase
MSEKVAIVGTGLVGSGWAIVFARAGFQVSLFDSVEGAASKARELIAERLVDLVEYGLIDDKASCLARIEVAGDLAAALKDAVYVQESAFERVDVKRALFSKIDKIIGKDTLVGSSSSGIPSSAFTEHFACRDRILIAHPVNPPYLVPVVELVPAPWTAPETVRGVRALMDRVGQKPVEMTREIEGFIVNRLQGVLLMEAWKLVADGLASVEDIDRTIADGLGLRWGFMGPFETIDLNASGGVADYAQRLGPLYQSIAASRPLHEVWDGELIAEVERQRRAVLPADKLAERTAWRDRRLMKLAKERQL